MTTATTATLTPGTRVELTRDWECYPIGIYAAGEKGTLATIDSDGSYWVKLDNHFPELADWGNELQIWADPELNGPEHHPETYLRAIPAPTV